MTHGKPPLTTPHGSLVADGEQLVKFVRVYCSQWASCGWTGTRIAQQPNESPESWKASRNKATAKPCPRCGKEVVA